MAEAANRHLCRSGHPLVPHSQISLRTPAPQPKGRRAAPRYNTRRIRAKAVSSVGLVMDDREADIPAARIVPAIGRPRGIAAGQHPDRRVAPQPHGRRLAVADIEPQKEPAVGPVKPEAAGERGLGDVEFAAVARAVFLDMRLVAPQRRRRRLDRQRHLAAAIVCADASNAR